jgi:hypothetical protein
MKSIFCILVFLVFQTLPGFSQVNHRMVVSDAVTRKGIPYATIKVVNKPDGTYADESGRFEVKILARDSLLVTCVGYQSKTVMPQQDTIFLDPVVVNLGEVKVRNKKPKEYAVGLAESKREGTLFLCGHVNVENSLMIRIPDSFTYYRIKGVKFNARHRNGISPVRLHIYAQGKDGMPDKELLPRDVIINKHLKSNGIIDLSHFNLIVNNRILFVGMEEILSKTKFNYYKGECIGFDYTLEEKEPQTYARTVLDPNYTWRPDRTPWLGGIKNGNPPNLMVSLIID